MKNHNWKTREGAFTAAGKLHSSRRKDNAAARSGRRITSMLPQIGLKENSVQSYG
jgi:hypothetical protein